jgi:hypothetical protein
MLVHHQAKSYYTEADSFTINPSMLKATDATYHACTLPSQVFKQYTYGQYAVCMRSNSARQPMLLLHTSCIAIVPLICCAHAGNKPSPPLFFLHLLYGPFCANSCLVPLIKVAVSDKRALGQRYLPTLTSLIPTFYIIQRYNITFGTI